MRILHIEDFFYPNAGYQINILPKYLAKYGHENIILTSQYHQTPMSLRTFFVENNIDNLDAEYENKYNVKIKRIKIRGFLSGRAIWYFKDVLNEINHVNPDIIYVHGNDTLIGIQIIRHFRNKKIKVITDSHMLEMASKNPFNKYFRNIYKKIVTPIINKNKIKVIRVQDSDFIFKHYNIKKELGPYISFGSDTDLFRSLENKDVIRDKLDIKDNHIFIYSGKLNEEKGAKLLLNAFQKKFTSAKKNVTLLILSNLPTDKYGEELQDLINKSQNNIIILGIQPYEKLPIIYSMADFAIFPKQCSLSFFDLQAMGLPIIFEDNEINRQRLWGINFIYGTMERELINTINQVLSLSVDEYNTRSQKAKEIVLKNYSYDNQARKYEKILQNEIDEYE